MFTIPDKGEGANNIQSLIFQEQLEILAAGMDGKDCVLSGCAVTAQGSPDMTVAVAKGAVLSNGVLLPVTAGNATITAADATNPRIDLVVVNSSGTKAVRAGTAAAAPKPPTRTANDVVIAMVYIPANDTTIASNQITDQRVMRTQGPIVIDRITTPLVINTSSALETYYTITFPSGLLNGGRAVRMRCGGTMLLNSGTPTLQIQHAFGGTTLFDDITVALTADVDRRVWHCDMRLIAQGNTDQHFEAYWRHNPITSGVTPPTTGLGDMANVVGGMGGGSSTVDADAGDRTFTLKLAMSVSNANNEIARDYAIAELF